MHMTGTARVHEFYSLGVENNAIWEKTNIASATSPRWKKVIKNMLGQAIRLDKSAYGGTLINEMTYNAKGQLVKKTENNRYNQLFTYGSLGRIVRSGYDVDGNGTLDLASMDRILEKVYHYLKDKNAQWWSYEYDCTYDGANSATRKTLGYNGTKLSGFSDSYVSDVWTTDIYGKSTIHRVKMLPASKQRIEYTYFPSATTTALMTYVNDVMTSSRSTLNLTTSYGYDGLGRRTTVTDPRTGVAKIVYNTTNQVQYTEDALGKQTNYLYDTAGRQAKITNTVGNTKTFAYNDRGQVIAQNGTGEYPVAFSYDAYGQTAGMTTYRANAITGDATTWTYDAASGLLTAKTDATGKATTYTYNVNGQLITRKWARTPLITTTYTYNNFGELLKTDYSDSTPDITYTYNRLGQPQTIVDALGTRTFEYDAYLKQSSETTSGLYAKTLTRAYDSVGRPSALTIGTEYATGFAYDATTGRMTQITGNGATFGFTYLANSNLVSKITNGSFTTNIAYDPKRNLITEVDNRYGTTSISKYVYTNDEIGRRKARAESGTAFGSSDTINYGYNNRSEVTSAVATSDTAYNYNYAYDWIGNRTTATESGSTFGYTSNALNEYTAYTKTVSGTTTTQTPTYDADGNMLTTGDGWTYTWNGENRLATATKGTTTLSFKYDYAGRRIEKNATVNGTTTNTRYVYDGFKMIEELNGASSNALLRKYVWQQNSQWFDVPLAVTEGTTTRFYTTDANKNVSEVLNANGTVASHYEYSPFGKQTAATGAYTANLFRFSSEVFDPETTLVYYNYRYYNPALGRWMSRDPIIWTGNLYAFIGNIPIIKFDILGLFSDGRESIREKLRQVCVPYEEYVSGTIMGIPIEGGWRGCRPYTPEEIEELIDDEYLGHSDFPGSDQFDYTAEDHDPATNPYDRPERHFQDPIDALNDVRSAIFSCNKHRFERAMHRLQDNWTHYAKGYRSTWFHGWHPVHWPIGHIGGGTYPDKDNEAWQRAANATQRMLNSWNRNCCKDKNGKWERKSSGCCDK